MITVIGQRNLILPRGSMVSEQDNQFASLFRPPQKFDYFLNDLDLNRNLDFPGLLGKNSSVGVA